MLKRLLLISITVFLSVFYASMAQTLVTTDPQPRNAILEEFTGIYCGYCPDGHKIAKAIMDANPGRVFAINIHSSDNYSKPSTPAHPDFRTQWGPALQTFGNLSGFPAGMVNRAACSAPQKPGGLCMSRGSWTTAVNNILNDPTTSPVNIGAKVKWDSQTRTIEVDVELYYTVDGNGANKLNIAFIESGVVGYQGSGGADYVHKHILRDLLTGQWGEQITQTTPTSLFTKKYTYVVSDKWVADNCDLVLFVTKSDNKDIFTGIQVPIITPNLTLSALGETFDAISAGGEFSNTVEITNTTPAQMNISLTTELSVRTPSDWTASIEGATTRTVPGNGKISVVYSIKPGATIGIGDATLKIDETGVQNPLSYSTQITGVSAEATHLEINDDEEKTNSIQASLGLISTDKFVTLSNSEYTKASSKLAKTDFLIWNSGKKGTLTSQEATVVDNLIKDGTKVFFNGSVALAMLTFENSGHPIFTTLGATWNNGDIQLNTLDLEGFPGDPISDSWEVTNVTPTNNGYFFQNHIITNTQTTTPIIKCKQTQQTIGFKVENTYGRSVYLGFNSDVIVNASLKNELLEACLNWINGGGSSTGPVIFLNKKNMNFDATEVNKTKTDNFTIENKGTENLTITNIKVEAKYSDIFDINLTSFDLEPNASQDIFVTFKPKEVISVNTKLIIESNAKDPSEISISASAITSVGDGVSGNNSFYLEALPNPFTIGSKLQLTLNDNTPRNIRIYATDANGCIISELADKSFENGTSAIEFNIDNLSSGKYFIIAESQELSAQLPIVILK